MTRARCARRTFSGCWAFHFWAPGSRAGRAFARRLLALAAIKDDGSLLRNAALQDILTEIRHRRALSLQHIVAEIRACGARRNTALQYIHAEIWFSARRACRARLRAAARAFLFA